MSKPIAIRILEIAILIISIALIIWAAPEMMERFGIRLETRNDDVASCIVEGPDLVAVSSRVRLEGGVITHTWPARSAVVAQLTTSQIRALLNTKGIMRVAVNRSGQINSIASVGIVY